jgi:transcription elongation factor Elf1
VQDEATYTCPHCWQVNTIVVDIAAGSQTFIQDCEVCCNPIEFRCEVDSSGFVALEANSIDQ